MVSINLFFMNLFVVEEKKSKSLEIVIASKKKIRHEISELNERLKQNKRDIVKFNSELVKLEGEDLKIST